jgi:probable F420-dependent oxidoreductase
MLFGLGIPTCREGLAYPSGFANLQTTARLAKSAERTGFDSLWANDHLATQRVIIDDLPNPPNFFEPIVAFAYLARQVERLRFVLATIVVPLREPVLLAKQIATLDQATDGQVVLGLGIGSYREELEAIHRDAGTINRGRHLDETVRALRLLFSQRRAEFAGAHFAFSEIEVAPKPVQDPLPIYLSGNAPGAIRRAAALADGSILAAASPEHAREAIDRLRAAAMEADRDPAEIQVCVQTWVGIGESEKDAHRAVASSQHLRRLQALQPDESMEALTRAFAAHNLMGTPEQIQERIAAFASVGVDHLGLVFLADTADDLMHRVELFGQAVLPHVRARQVA